MRIGSLFSGIGGLELGLERAGVGTVAWQCEADPYCRRVLAKHWPDVPIFEDVRTLTDPPDCEVLCGGFPCQDISAAGKGAGLDGERSGLFFEFVRIVRVVRPQLVVLENVPALTARGLGVVLGELARAGLDAQWGCLSAAGVGAPHLRRRIFIVAYPSRPPRENGQPRRADRELLRESAPIRNWKLQGQAGSQLGGSCEACGEPWCGTCDGHWALCGCPGDHDGDVIDCPAEPREVAYPKRHRLEGFNNGRTETPPAFGRAWHCWWEAEPGVGRVADGVPARVDRLRALGNAVVPQVAEQVGRIALEIIQ